MSHKWNGFDIGADIKNLPAVPLELLYWCAPVAVSMTSAGEEITFTIVRTGAETESLIKTHEFPLPSQVRDRFLRVKTPDDALAFLRATGPFLSPVDQPGILERLTWASFQRWQKIVRLFGQNGRLFILRGEYGESAEILPKLRALEDDTEMTAELLAEVSRAPAETLQWLQGLTPTLTIAGDDVVARSEKRPPKLKLMLDAMTVVDACVGSFKVAKMLGVKHALCARDGCGVLFEERPTRGKRYCSQKCAHHANVTDQRRLCRGER